MKKFLIGLGMVGILVMTGCDLLGQYEGKTAKEWSEMYYSENTIRVNMENQYADIAREANNNIDDANNFIQDAQSTEGGDYEDLENTIENLEIIDNIPKSLN